QGAGPADLSDNVFERPKLVLWVPAPVRRIIGQAVGIDPLEAKRRLWGLALYFGPSGRRDTSGRPLGLGPAAFGFWPAFVEFAVRDAMKSVSHGYFLLSAHWSGPQLLVQLMSRPFLCRRIVAASPAPPDWRLPAG